MYRLLIITISLILLLGISLIAGEIHEASESGDIATLKLLLDKNPNLVNARDSLGSLPLHLTSLRGHIKGVKLLVEAGAEISAGDGDNTTPLVCATIGGHLDVVKFLVAHGAAFNETDNFGQTVITTASGTGNLELIDYLVENGADINSCTNNGRSALHTAAFRGQIGTIRHLLDRGANLMARDNDSMSILCAAAYSGQGATIEALIELGCDVNEAANTHGHNPLIAATWNGHNDVVELLLAKGADLTWRNNEGGTPLHIAAQRGDTVLAQLFIDKGLDINVTNYFGEKPISEAAWNQADMVRWLIDKGADVNAPNDTLRAPIMSAIYGNNTEAVRAILSAGASPDYSTQTGNPPFYVAIGHGNLEIAGLLLEAGADIDIKENNFNRTSLHFAAINGNSEIARFLISHDASIDPLDNDNHTPLFYAVKYGNQSIAEFLKERGARCDGIEEDYNPPALITETLPEGKATIWYLGHSGWGIKTSTHFLIFDYFEEILKPDKPCLRNGHIDPVELAKVVGDTKVLVFSSHEHGDHYDTSIFGWRDVIPEITYVLGHQPFDQNGYEYISPHNDKEIDGLHIWTINSTDAGVGYLIDVDGLTIFHAGDHANGEIGLHAEYTDEIDYLAGMSKQIDLAFLPISGCSLGTPESVREGVYYALDKLKPTVFFPQHGGTAGYRYREFAETAKTEGISQKTNCAENSGDCFTF